MPFGGQNAEIVSGVGAGGVVGFGDLEFPHFVLKRCAFQAQTLRGAAWPGDLA